MIEALLSLVLLLIIGGLLYYCVSLLPLPEPFPAIIRVCVIIICVLLLISVLFGGVDLPHVRSFR